MTKKAKNAVDLSELDTYERGEEPQPLVLIDPRDGSPVGGKEAPATLYVLSLDGETMVTWNDEQANKNLKRTTPMSNEEAREFLIARSARCLMARPWVNVEWKGKPVPFSLTSAKMLMTRLPWAKKQVDALASREAAFLGNSLPPSSSSDDTISDSPSGQEPALQLSANG
jgi:hypothetical protein